MERIPSLTEEKNEKIRTVTDLNKIIESAPQLSDIDTSEAPFADYHQNTQESWNHVPPEVIDKYLKEKLFFNTSHIPYESRKEIGEVSSDEPIKIPLPFSPRTLLGGALVLDETHKKFCKITILWYNN